MMKNRRQTIRQCRTRRRTPDGSSPALPGDGVVRNSLPAQRSTLNVQPSAALALASKRINKLRNASSLTSSALEQTNPLRGLTLARAVALMEAVLRGEYTQAAWTLWHIEQTDADLFALVSRRTSAIMEMDWDIKIVSQKTDDGRSGTAGPDDSLAKKQAAILRAAYERIDNLSEAIEELSLAFCRGFTILQLEPAVSEIENQKSAIENTAHLGPYKPWNILRAGLDGDWFFNPDARAISARSLPEENRIDPANHIIYSPRVCLMRIALYKFIRMNLSQKDWDAFIEIFGLPSAFIIGPPNVAKEKEAAYETAALEAAEGGGGYLPNGADVKFATEPRGINPFRDHLKYLQEQLILAGTGGLLTMLSQPTGIGAGASGAHEDTFKTIAHGEAKKISEVFQKQFDKKVLSAAFPDQPILAYFELAAREEQDIGGIIDHALKLSQAGYQMDAGQLSEKTGYTITLNPAGGAGSLGSLLPNNPAIAGAQTARLRNSASAGEIANQKHVERSDPDAPRSTLNASRVAAAVAKTLGVRSDLLTPFFAALEEKINDKTLTDAELLDAIEAMAKTLPELMTETSVQDVAGIIEQTLADALVAGVAETTKEQKP